MTDKSLLAILNNKRDEIIRALANIMKAVEQGIFNATTKNRMDELESQLTEVEDKITVEQYKVQNQLKKEEIIEYLTHTIKQQPKLLIRNLIQKIVLYDDRFEIYFNYLNNMPPTEDNPDKTIRELSLTGCSDTSPLCLPKKRQVVRLCRFFVFHGDKEERHVRKNEKKFRFRLYAPENDRRQRGGLRRILQNDRYVPCGRLQLFRHRARLHRRKKRNRHTRLPCQPLPAGKFRFNR